MTDLIARARAFAEAQHAGQTRKGAEAAPYITHVAEVAEMVQRFGEPPEAVAAAWLHDVVEDCPPTGIKDIADLFGATVAAIVAEVTDDKTLPKAERKRLQVVNAARKSPEAALIKIADKTSNVRAIEKAPPTDWSTARKLAYLDWAEQVVTALPHRPVAAMTAFTRALDDTRAALT